MPPEGCPEPHHAEVVACDLFATPNSLKSRVARKVLSPFSNIHAVTPKLRTHSTSTPFKINGRRICVQRSISKRARCLLVPHFPRFRALALFGRRPLQRGEGLVIAGGRKPTHFADSCSAAKPAHVASSLAHDFEHLCGMPFITGSPVASPCSSCLHLTQASAIAPLRQFSHHQLDSLR